MERVSDALDLISDQMDDRCANSLGMSSEEEYRHLELHTEYTHRNLGMIGATQVLPDGTRRPAPVAQFEQPRSGVSATIVLNNQVNWENPNLTPGVDDKGNPTTHSLMTNKNYFINQGNAGGPRMTTSTQFLAATLLHEFKHYKSEEHDENYDRNIFSECSRVFR